MRWECLTSVQVQCIDLWAYGNGFYFFICFFCAHRCRLFMMNVHMNAFKTMPPVLLFNMVCMCAVALICNMTALVDWELKKRSPPPTNMRAVVCTGKDSVVCPCSAGVMPHCLDPGTVVRVDVEKFEGDQWEKAIVNSDVPSRSKMNWAFCVCMGVRVNSKLWSKSWTEPSILCAYGVCEWYLCWIRGNIVNILCTLLWLCCVTYVHWIYGDTVNMAAWVHAIQWIFCVHYCGCMTHLLWIHGNTVNIVACVLVADLHWILGSTLTFCVHCCGHVWSRHIFVEFIHHHELSSLCAYGGMCVCVSAWMGVWMHLQRILCSVVHQVFCVHGVFFRVPMHTISF